MTGRSVAPCSFTSAEQEQANLTVPRRTRERPPTEVHMARHRTLTGTLYKAARISATSRAIRTGHGARRAKNMAVGRALGRGGVWRRLWK